MLIFAYGSLIWRPGFNHDDVFRASVCGFERRFWQASHDHRGTPEHPGRVVTLVPCAGSVCHGLAYRLPVDRREQILDDLDYREKDGYVRQILELRDADNRAHTALTWIASSDNPSWRGDETLEQSARLIAQRAGPSGSNAQYLFRLAQSLEQHDIEDLYIKRLYERVKSMTL